MNQENRKNARRTIIFIGLIGIMLAIIIGTWGYFVVINYAIDNIQLKISSEVKKQMEVPDDYSEKVSSMRGFIDKIVELEKNPFMEASMYKVNFFPKIDEWEKNKQYFKKCTEPLHNPYQNINIDVIPIWNCLITNRGYLNFIIGRAVFVVNGEVITKQDLNAYIEHISLNTTDILNKHRLDEITLRKEQLEQQKNHLESITDDEKFVKKVVIGTSILLLVTFCFLKVFWTALFWAIGEYRSYK